MTGTWRDTLFVWEGSVTVVPAPKKTNTKEHPKEEEPETVLQWKGSWVGCTDCSDARMAATPNAKAFQESEMEFHVESTSKQENRRDLFLYDMTGGSGWDLGEGDEKERHQDFQHRICTKIDLEKGDDAAAANTLVVAKGNNNFGAFVSTGYVTVQDNNNQLRMILARRYLDHQDFRESWSADLLYDRIALHDSGIWKPTGNSNFQRRCAPWCTILLKAPKMTTMPRKRTRDEEDGLKLSMPCPDDDFEPTLQIHQDGSIESKVRWVEQCHGCGLEVRDPAKACVISAQWKNKSDEVVGSTLPICYCTSDCVKHQGARAWAIAGSNWAQKKEHEGCTLMASLEDSFFQEIKSDDGVKQLFIDNGW